MDGVKTEDSGLLLLGQTDPPSVDEGGNGGSPGESGEDMHDLKKGPWTPEEDKILVDYVNKNGEGTWNTIQKKTSLSRCGKSCRLRWVNHLKPNLKKGPITPEEGDLIIKLHREFGNKWAVMATKLPGRTDNEIKNFWNTRLKRCQRGGFPLYPSHICPQVPMENQHSAGQFTSGKKRSYECLQENAVSISYTPHANSFDTPKPSYAPAYPDYPSYGAVGPSIRPDDYVSVQQSYAAELHRLRKSETLIPKLSDCMAARLAKLERTRFRYSFPYRHDQSIQNMATVGRGQITGNQAPLNGNFSTSRPIAGPVKSELPSFPKAVVDPCSWPDHTMTPAAPCPEVVGSPVESECVFDRHSGLLESVLHPAQALIGRTDQLSIKSTISSVAVPCDKDTSLEIDPCQFLSDELFGHMPPSGLDATVAAGEYDHNLVNIPPFPKELRPDASPDSSAIFWIGMHGVQELLLSGTSPGFDHEQGPDALWWNNMPGACQIFEIP